MRSLRTSALAAAAALLSVSSVAAQSGGVGGDPGAQTISKGPWSGEIVATVVGDGRFDGVDGIRVGLSSDGSQSNGGSSGGGGTGPPGPPPCVNSGIRFTQLIPLPNLTIESLPETRGVVGTQTYFWIDSPSFDGDAFIRDVNAEYTQVRQTVDPTTGALGCERRVVPLTLPVYFWPIGYRWTFGDDKEFTPENCRTRTRRPSDCQSGLGEQGTRGIPHVYEISSLREPDSEFTVSLRVDFRAALRLGTNTWLQLASSVPQTQSRDLRVEQIQSVLVE